MDPASFADDLGFGRGDVIAEVNRQSVNTVDEYQKAMAQLKPGSNVVFKVLRQGGRGPRADGVLAGYCAGGKSEVNLQHRAGDFPQNKGDSSLLFLRAGFACKAWRSRAKIAGNFFISDDLQNATNGAVAPRDVGFHCVRQLRGRAIHAKRRHVQHRQNTKQAVARNPARLPSHRRTKTLSREVHQRKFVRNRPAGNQALVNQGKANL